MAARLLIKERFEKKYCLLPKQSLFLPRLQSSLSLVSPRAPIAIDTEIPLKVSQSNFHLHPQRPISRQKTPISNKFPPFSSSYPTLVTLLKPSTRYAQCVAFPSLIPITYNYSCLIRTLTIFELFLFVVSEVSTGRRFLSLALFKKLGWLGSTITYPW